MSQNNQNPQRQQNQQPSQQQDKQQPATPAPTERETMQAKKDKIQGVLVKFVMKSPNVNAQVRATLNTTDLMDVRLVPRGLILSLVDRSSFEVKEVPVFVGAGNAAFMPRDAAEALAREWKAINESGALRS